MQGSGHPREAELDLGLIGIKNHQINVTQEESTASEEQIVILGVYVESISPGVKLGVSIKPIDLPISLKSCSGGAVIELTWEFH